MIDVAERHHSRSAVINHKNDEIKGRLLMKRIHVVMILAVLLILTTASTVLGPQMTSDGAVQVTFGPGDDRYPDWSPDGTQIVFESDRYGNKDLFVVPVTGGSGTQITSDSAWDARPAWSPDGSMIAFESDRNVESAGAGYPKCELFLVPPTGGAVTQVTDWPRYNERPHWAPDGSELVYCSDYNPSTMSMLQAPDDGALHPANLWRIPPTGGTPIQITVDTGYENDAEWSPDGGTIAFSADYAGNWDIWSCPVGGGAATQLTTDPALDQDPTWSPDGSAVAFWSLRSGNADIWVVSAMGGTPIQITTDSGFDWGPSWSPDGSQLAFFSNRSNINYVYIIDVETSGVRQQKSSTWGLIKSKFRDD
jgi:Tol biopolymer transport system component